MIAIRDEIQQIIDRYKHFFGQNVIQQSQKRKMQNYFRRNSTGYAPQILLHFLEEDIELYKIFMKKIYKMQ